MKPLAEKMRPKNFSEIIGQEKVVAFLEKSLPQTPSLLLFGPPGSGKTTIARVLALKSDLSIKTLSAVSDGLPALRKVLAESEEEDLLLFVDEIHRWNKAQQDALLPYVESGQIVLVGATTENPAFEVNAALLSRMQILRLEGLGDDDILALIKRAEGEFSFSVAEEVYPEILLYAAGDARRALNLLDRALLLRQGQETINREMLEAAAGERISQYGRHGIRDDIISAWIKSMRASDKEGALYWLARMESGGEDPKFVARRLIIFASEDVGLADSEALSLANGALAATTFVGEPECWINLSHVTSYMALAPKSWSAYRSWLRAQGLVEKGQVKNPDKKVRREHYLHPADSEEAEEGFLPEEFRGQIWGDN